MVEKIENKESCETCEHKQDSGQEYCGSCDSTYATSNWQEAGWIKDKKIEKLILALEIIIKYSEENIFTEDAVITIAKKALEDTNAN